MTNVSLYPNRQYERLSPKKREQLFQVLREQAEHRTRSFKDIAREFGLDHSSVFYWRQRLFPNLFFGAFDSRRVGKQEQRAQKINQWKESKLRAIEANLEFRQTLAKPQNLYKELLKKRVKRECKHGIRFFLFCLSCRHIVGSERQRSLRSECGHKTIEKRCSLCGVACAADALVLT